MGEAGVDAGHEDRNEYPATTATKVMLFVAGGFFCLLVFTAPLGIFLIAAALTAHARFTPGGFEAVNWASGFTRRMTFATTRRLGVFFQVGAGLAGMAATAAAHGSRGAMILCWEDEDGKTRRTSLTVYQNADEILQRIVEATGLEVEAMERGWFDVKWPANPPRRRATGRGPAAPAPAAVRIPERENLSVGEGPDGRGRGCEARRTRYDPHLPQRRPRARDRQRRPRRCLAAPVSAAR